MAGKKRELRNTGVAVWLCLVYAAAVAAMAAAVAVVVTAWPVSAETNGPGRKDEPYVSAGAAILMDARTGQVLYAKNPLQRRPPASTTKVLTALLAIETGKLRDKVKISLKAARTGGSTMYLKAGETYTLSDLLYGALLNSGNDACVAIAEHIAGGVDEFAVLMNMKALSLGAVNTHFTNPHGLPDPSHYTCAYDLALFARYALKNRTFAEIVGTRDKVVDLPGPGWDRRLANTNQLLWRYLWAEGIKTGTTSAAGQCLVSAATKGNRQLIAVVLRSRDRWNDSIRLFEYGFNNFEYKQVAVAGARSRRYCPVQGGERDQVPAVYAADLGLLLPVNHHGAPEERVWLDPQLRAPVRQGQIVGSVSYFVDRNFVSRVELVAAADVRPAGFWARLAEWLGSWWRSVF